MSWCQVKNCKNNSSSVTGVKYHRFPKNAVLKEKWILATGRYNWFPHKNARICSSHFEDDLIIKKKKLTGLAEGAIPTLHLHPILDELAEKTSTDDDTFLSLVVPPKRMKMSMEACSDDDIPKSLDLPSGSQSTSESVYKPALTDTPRRRKLKMTVIRTQQNLQKRQLEIRRLRRSKLRLSKKVAELKDIIATLQHRSLISEEDGRALESTNRVEPARVTTSLNEGWSKRL